jgi:hypothetical protein
VRVLNAPRSLRLTGASYPQFPQHVGSNFWTPNNSLKARLRPSPTLRESLSLRICAPTVPASSKSYGCRSRGASTCRQGVRGGCQAASSDRNSGGKSRAIHRRLRRFKGKEAPRRSQEPLGSRLGCPPYKTNNPVSRDVAAGACGKLTARQPRERGVPRLKSAPFGTSRRLPRKHVRFLKLPTRV